VKLPDPELWAELDRWERWTYRVSAGVNEHPVLKEAATRWLSKTSRRWMEGVVGESLHVEGADLVPRDRSILLVANHQTYFDFYAASVALWRMYARKPFLYCPVRSAFFYDHPVGAAINAGAAGFAMYPPIFRERRSGAGLNKHALDRCADLLRWSPRTIVAIHPEGTRNRTDDPYQLREPRPGAGIVAHRVRATVVPLFINGLTQELAPLVRSRLLGRPELIRLFFGPPVALDDLYDQPADREVHAAIVRRMMQAIEACAARDRAYMASRR
jgi:1-acyl-sn-glycerol-3-phosphate acyltransferase